MPLMPTRVARALIGPRILLPGETAVLRAILELNPAEIRALHTTPKIIVPAQGPGSWIVPLAISVQFLHNSSPFSSNENAQYGWDPLGSISQYATVGLNLNTWSASEYELIEHGAPAIADALSAVVNKPFGVQLAADVTGGDSSLRFTVYYVIETSP